MLSVKLPRGQYQHQPPILAQKTRRQVAPRACKKRSLGVIAPNRVALFSGFQQGWAEASLMNGRERMGRKAAGVWRFAAICVAHSVCAPHG